MSLNTPKIDPEIVCVHEGLIWASAAIFGAGAFALGYLSGIFGWVG